MMNKDQFAGTANAIGGQIEEAAGALTKDRCLQAEGIVDQVKGAAQSLYGDTKEKVHDTYDRVAPVTRERIGRVADVTRENSLLFILAAGAVGFAVAVAFRNSNAAPSDSWSS
jgi:uncharacterized protein YjbJ (UPF0337 family)